jgi:hypothetical protein
MDCNPFLKKGAAGGRGALETPLNIEWQTRAAPPTEFENRLGDALEEVFAAGAEALAEVVARLNAMHVFDAHGRAWTEASFEETMRRLGA